MCRGAHGGGLLQVDHRAGVAHDLEGQERRIGHVCDLDALAGGRGLLRAHAHLALAASALTAADLTDWMFMVFPR